MSRRLELEVRGYVFDIDDKPMWEFYKAAWRSSEDLGERRAFVRECVLRMLEIGAVPYEVAHGEPWARSTKRWEGMSPNAMISARSMPRIAARSATPVCLVTPGAETSSRP